MSIHVNSIMNMEVENLGSTKSAPHLFKIELSIAVIPWVFYGFTMFHHVSPHDLLILLASLASLR